MTKLKLALRIWMTVTSMLSFLAGWILLAHSPKPIQPAGNSSLPALEPLPPLSAFNQASDNQSQLFFEAQPQFRMSSNPFFRTGGS